VWKLPKADREQEVLRGGKNGYFVVLFGYFFLVVARWLFVADGLWFGCLGGWLMCRIVFDIYLYFRHFFSAFRCVYIFFTSVCYQRVCMQGVNCSTRFLRHIYFFFGYFSSAWKSSSKHSASIFKILLYYSSELSWGHFWLPVALDGLRFLYLCRHFPAFWWITSQTPCLVSLLWREKYAWHVRKTANRTKTERKA